MTDKPYVSVVIVGRNDDYGQDFLTRINTFVRCLDHQIRAHSNLWELVVVEWNPEPGRPGLAEVIHASQHLTVRVITVPPDLHDTVGGSSPVLEFHAKNVGIRRARGEFVLVTNPDILFSAALIDEIAQRKLRVDTVYRTDRYDFVTTGMEAVAADDLMEFALSNVFVVHGMAGAASVSMPIEPGQRNWNDLPASVGEPGVWHTNGCGDFMLAAREAFYTVRGLYETVEHRWHIDSISLLRFVVAKMRQQIWTAPRCVFHQHHERRAQDVAFQDLDVAALARRGGSTDWGFRGHDFVETLLETSS